MAGSRTSTAARPPRRPPSPVNAGPLASVSHNAARRKHRSACRVACRYLKRVGMQSLSVAHMAHCSGAGSVLPRETRDGAPFEPRAPEIRCIHVPL
jgi:hypothetical protein